MLHASAIKFNIHRAKNRFINKNISAIVKDDRRGANLKPSNKILKYNSNLNCDDNFLLNLVFS